MFNSYYLLMDKKQNNEERRNDIVYPRSIRRGSNRLVCNPVSEIQKNVEDVIAWFRLFLSFPPSLCFTFLTTM